MHVCDSLTEQTLSSGHALGNVFCRLFLSHGKRDIHMYSGSSVSLTYGSFKLDSSCKRTSSRKAKGWTMGRSVFLIKGLRKKRGDKGLRLTIKGVLSFICLWICQMGWKGTQGPEAMPGSAQTHRRHWSVWSPMLFSLILVHLHLRITYLVIFISSLSNFLKYIWATGTKPFGEKMFPTWLKEPCFCESFVFVSPLLWWVLSIITFTICLCPSPHLLQWVTLVNTEDWGHTRCCGEDILKYDTKSS